MAPTKIGISLRHQLLKDTLSSVLSAAGFFLLDDSDQHDKDTIVIIDLTACRDPEALHTHQQRGVKIVVLAGAADSLDMSADEIAAVNGVLTDGLSVDVFVRALRLICLGERVFPRDLALGRKSSTPSPTIEPQPAEGIDLSPREREVLLNLVKGHPNKIIAQHLDTSEATVKVHLKNLLRKIRVDNRTQVAIWALDNLPELNDAPRGTL